MKRQTLIFGISILVLNLLVLGYFWFRQPEMAYFDYNTVYNNCALKQSLEKDLLKVTSVRKSELDSLQLQLTFLSQELESGVANNTKLQEFENMKQRFLTIKDRYEQENIQLKETYFNQIRQEINDKSKLYAEREGYAYLFSASGDGSLMYAAKSEDVTADFQAYIDQR